MREIREVLPATRGRPAVRVTIEGAPVSASAARLYGLLSAAPSTRLASNEVLASLLACSEQTITRALGELESAGLIERKYDKLGRRLEMADRREPAPVMEARR